MQETGTPSATDGNGNQATLGVGGLIHMKSFKKRHSEPVISLLEIHTKETMRMLVRTWFQGFPSWRSLQNKRLGTIQRSGGKPLSERAVAGPGLGDYSCLNSEGRQLP